jgi:2-oxo-4-hydroxy-4-carboxy-5-ureidoimidazoline decarboxylase
MAYSLAEINQMSQAEFGAVFGVVFEKTPAIALETWNAKPFQDFSALYDVMVQTVEALSAQSKLDLIHAHPDLGSKLAMAEASVQEQIGAGLTQLSCEEYERFQALNQAYRAKFGFPFIIAVKSHTKASILNAFEKRLNHSTEQEYAQALSEILRIAYFRLQNLIESEETVI